MINRILSNEVKRLSQGFKVVLTGSSNFLLLEKITQSLAGRGGLLTLLPLSIDEIKTSPDYQQASDANSLMFNCLMNLRNITY